MSLLVASLVATTDRPLSRLPTSLSKCDTHADADVAVRLRFFLALQDDDLAKAPLSDDGRRVLSLKVKVDETDCVRPPCSFLMAR